MLRQATHSMAAPLLPCSQGDGNVVLYYGDRPFYKFGMTAYWDSGTWLRPNTVRPTGWTGGFYLTLHVSGTIMPLFMVCWI